MTEDELIRALVEATSSLTVSLRARDMAYLRAWENGVTLQRIADAVGISRSEAHRRVMRAREEKGD